jgi:hypothetical protein
MPTHWDDRIKNLAYEIWRVDTRQSMREVAEKVNSLEQTDIPSDTVDDWRKRGKWHIRWTEERQALSPRMLERHLVGLRVAAPELIEKLRRHVHASSARDENGNPIDPDFLDISQVHAAKHLITENRSNEASSIHSVCASNRIPRSIAQASHSRGPTS